jgi:hypothetical protein
MDGGIMDGQWRNIGDDGDENLLQIPVPAGCQNGVSGSESRFLMAVAQGKPIWGKCHLPDIFRSEDICRQTERSRRRPSHPHNWWARLMTHKYRGCIIVLSINKSVEPNEEQKVLMSGFDQGITINTSKQVFRGIW